MGSDAGDCGGQRRCDNAPGGSAIIPKIGGAPMIMTRNEFVVKKTNAPNN
jgi:hypothetical protein